MPLGARGTVRGARPPDSDVGPSGYGAEYAAGTIVKIGGTKEITQTTTANDVAIFGVVSTAPGFEMNSAAGTDATHPYIALAGRVPCKVIGKISKGDRIVSSGTDGVGMAAEDDYSWKFVLGRALEDKTTEEAGTIEIVLGAK